MSEPVTRPEFDNALEGIRREISAMGAHIGSDLAEIRAQLSLLLATHHEEGREMGEITTRVDALEKAHAESRTTLRVLVGGVLTALAGHLITWILKGFKP